MLFRITVLHRQEGLGLQSECNRQVHPMIPGAGLSTKGCVFLKDMWRPDVPGVEPEHVWYMKLIKAKVPHLVGFKHAFDVVPSTPPQHY